MISSMERCLELNFMSKWCFWHVSGHDEWNDKQWCLSFQTLCHDHSHNISSLISFLLDCVIDLIWWMCFVVLPYPFAQTRGSFCNIMMHHKSFHGQQHWTALVSDLKVVLGMVGSSSKVRQHVFFCVWVLEWFVPLVPGQWMTVIISDMHFIIQYHHWISLKCDPTVIEAERAVAHGPRVCLLLSLIPCGMRNQASPKQKEHEGNAIWWGGEGDQKKLTTQQQQWCWVWQSDWFGLRWLSETSGWVTGNTVEGRREEVIQVWMVDVSMLRGSNKMKTEERGGTEWVETKADRRPTRAWASLALWLPSPLCLGHLSTGSSLGLNPIRLYN